MAIQSKDIRDLMGVNVHNVYMVEMRVMRVRGEDNRFADKLKETFSKHGKIRITFRTIFLQTILHIADYNVLFSLIQSDPSIYGVVFLSNVHNGTEVYHKAQPQGRLENPVPWNRGGIALSLSKMKEVGDEILTYPKKEEAIKFFMERFFEFSERVDPQDSSVEEIYSPMFDRKCRPHYVQDYFNHTTSDWDENYSQYHTLDRKLVRHRNPGTF